MTWRTQEFLTAEEAARLEQETLARNQELLDRPASADRR